MDDFTGRVIRSYKLGQLIGTGGFGAVYQAHQDIVNREVAIKIILPAYANHPDFIRSFEVEAQLVASLEHPHIVPLYDYWREPDSAYLVMRWLRAGSLRTALQARPWSLEEIAQVLDQISAALTMAHRQGVVHRDIKPDNILLDDLNNAYLTDFGIAKDIIGNRNPVDKDVMVGSPEYMAPEQIQSNAVTPQTDIYSLGIVLYQILTGEVPFVDDNVTKLLSQHIHEPMPSLQAVRPDLPNSLNLVVWRATAKHPDGRYPDALAMAQDFRRVALSTEIMIQPAPKTDDVSTNPLGGADGTRVIGVLTEPPNPYKGLRSFEEADARDFFGRESLAASLIEKLRTRMEEPNPARFLAVVGPSGSGKSSVVKAGLIPALRLGALPNSDDWFIITLTPGFKPFDELKEALLRVASAARYITLDALSSDEAYLHQVVQAILPAPDSKLVLFIDQFEEVFTLLDDESERVKFLNSLRYAATASDGRVWLMITLRADFYDRPLLYPGFGELIREYTEVVLPLTVAELQRTIVGPAERIGLSIEPGLATLVVTDVNEQPGALPLLQYALTELYERRDKRTLTVKAYREIGGVLGALARRAEEVYESLDAESKVMARQLFLRLVTLGDSGEATRRRVTWTELLSIGDDSMLTQQLVDVFSKYRLFTLDRDPATRAPVVQLAHEALIRSWERLRGWIDENRDDLRLQRQITAATLEWTNNNRDMSYLVSGSRLAQFEELAAKTQIVLSEPEKAYIREGAKMRRRATYRFRAFIASLVVFSLVSLGLAGFAFDRQQQAIRERDRADAESRIARSRELAATSLNNDSQVDLSLLLSLEALNTADTFEARSSLLTELQLNPRLSAFLYGHADAVRTVAFSPDGELLASGGKDNAIIFWSAQTRQIIQPVGLGHTGWVNSVAFSPDGTLLASASADGTLILWDAQTHQPVRTLQGHTDEVWTVAFSPDGKLLASSGADASIILWDVNTGESIGGPLEGHEDIVYSVAFSPDGKTLASASGDATVRLWDIETRQPIGQPLEGHTNWVLTLAFNISGEWLISSGADSEIIIWDVTTRDVVAQFPSEHSDWVRKVVFSPDGHLFATASDDNTIHLWDAESGQRLGEPLANHQDAVWSLAFSADSQTLASASADTTVYLWNTSPYLGLQVGQVEQDETVSRVAYSPDGKLLATAGGDPTALEGSSVVRLWDATTLSEVGMLSGHNGPITSVAFSPDSRFLASSSADKTLIIWDIATQQPAFSPLVGHTDVVWSVAYSPDGKLLVSSGDGGRILRWDTTNGQLLGEALVTDGGVLALAFSPDGKILAAGNRANQVILWDVEAGQPLGEPLLGHTDAVTGLAFSPDSKTLVSASRDFSLIMWDVASRQPLRPPLLGHTYWVSAVAYSPDSQLLASVDRDGNAILWDADSGLPLGQPLITGGDWLTTVAFSPSGTALAVGSFDNTISLWQVGLQAWRSRACSVANRNLSQDEWQTFFDTTPYRETCTFSAS